MSKKVLVDTDILSSLMKKNENVLQNTSIYLKVYDVLMFSVITKYEILRGLKSKNANRQILNFLQFCQRCEILPVNDQVVDSASSIYADLRKKGLKISDADILIGSTALVYGLGLVTNNINHFKYIPDLVLFNWILNKDNL